MPAQDDRNPKKLKLGNDQPESGSDPSQSLDELEFDSEYTEGEFSSSGGTEISESDDETEDSYEDSSQLDEVDDHEAAPGLIETDSISIKVTPLQSAMLFTPNKDLSAVDEVEVSQSSVLSEGDTTDVEYVPQDRTEKLKRYSHLPPELLQAFLDILKIDSDTESVENDGSTSTASKADSVPQKISVLHVHDPRVLVGYTDYLCHHTDVCYNHPAYLRDCLSAGDSNSAPTESLLQAKLMDNSGHKTFKDFTHPENPHRIINIAHFIKNHTNLFDFDDQGLASSKPAPFDHTDQIESSNFEAHSGASFGPDFDKDADNHPRKELPLSNYKIRDPSDAKLMDFLLNPGAYNCTYAKELQKEDVVYKNRDLEVIDELVIHQRRANFLKRHLNDFISTLKFVHHEKYLYFLRRISHDDLMEDTDTNIPLSAQSVSKNNEKSDADPPFNIDEMGFEQQTSVFSIQPDGKLDQSTRSEADEKQGLLQTLQLSKKFTDGSVYISGLSTINRSLLGSYASILMADRVLDPSTSFKSGFLINRPPGHHATNNKAGGFCLLNNAAITAAYLMKKDFKEKLFNYLHGNHKLSFAFLDSFDDLTQFYEVFCCEALFNTFYQEENGKELNLYTLDLLESANPSSTELTFLELTRLDLKPFLDGCTKPRIVVLDFDIHYGNGTAGIFYTYKNVTTISVHRYDDGHYYPGRGFEKFVSSLQDTPVAKLYKKEWEHNGGYWMDGAGLGKGHNINIPLSYIESPFDDAGLARTLEDHDALTDPREYQRGGYYSDADYLQIFKTLILPVMHEINPDIITVAAGFDAGAGDILGNCMLTPFFYYSITHALASRFACPLLYCLEGGYNYDSLATGTYACIKALVETARHDGTLPPGVKNPYLDPSFDIVDLLYLKRHNITENDSDELKNLYSHDASDIDDEDDASGSDINAHIFRGDSIHRLNSGHESENEIAKPSAGVSGKSDHEAAFSKESVESQSNNIASKASISSDNIDDDDDDVEDNDDDDETEEMSPVDYDTLFESTGDEGKTLLMQGAKFATEHNVSLKVRSELNKLIFDSAQELTAERTTVSDNYYYHKVTLTTMLKKVIQHFSQYYDSLKNVEINDNFLDLGAYI